MKRFIAAVSVCFALCTLFPLPVYSGLLSPALAEIEKNLTLGKHGKAGENITFSAKDFDEAFCEKVRFIKIRSLPGADEGTLALGKEAIYENQTVDRDEFSKIVFRPYDENVRSAEFVFGGGAKSTEIRCTISFTDGENSAPTAKNQKIETAENVSAFKFLEASDPENDRMIFEVTEYPKNGTVRLSSDSSGYFSYTPKKGFTGTDSFEYTVSDEHGNSGGKAKVTVSVFAVGTAGFDDLEGHWAYSSALKTASMGLMSGEYDGESYNFNPSEPVSRGDFLAAALIAAGYEESIEFTAETSFSDDADIPLNIKSYAEYAKKCGIVGGYPDENGSAAFKSKNPITRAESAVIAERILALSDSDGYENSFSDSDDVPAWASGAFRKLTGAGIIKGTGSGELLPAEYLTRAQAAEMLCGISGSAAKFVQT